MLTELDASGRADETLLFVTTDHAMPFRRRQASSFDSGDRCPLIVVNPAQRTRGIRSQAVMNWVDFCLTILEWCGVEYPEGEDALPAARSCRSSRTTAPTRAAAPTTTPTGVACAALQVRPQPRPPARTPLPSDLIRSLTWTAVREDGLDLLGERSRDRFLQQDRETLFNMEADATESRNLIDDPALVGVAVEMRAKVLAFRQATEPWLETSYQRGEAPIPTA